MKAPWQLVVLFAALACSQLDCGSDDEVPPIQQLCEKTDECNRLPAGDSVQECVDATSECLDGLAKPDRAEWEKLARECLKASDCQDFAACYREMNPADC